jgi:hypothetical protein
MSQNEKSLGFTVLAFGTAVEPTPQALGHKHASADVIPLHRGAAPRLVKDLVCGNALIATHEPGPGERPSVGL